MFARHAGHRDSKKLVHNGAQQRVLRFNRLPKVNWLRGVVDDLTAVIARDLN